MRITNRMMIDSLQRNIANNASSLVTLQDQLASGKRLRKPSDDPRAMSAVLTLKATSQQNDQCLRNINSAQEWLSATGAALDQLSTVLVQARDLALKGATDSLGEEERKALGKQVEVLLGEALESANASEGGKYLFAGFRTDAPPFADDGSFTQSPSGPVGEIQREVRPGVELVVNLRGNQVVDGNMPIQQTLQTLIDLRDQLNTGGSSSAYVAGLSSCVEGVTAMQGTVGVKLNGLDATEAALNDKQIDLAAQLSREQDADTAETVTKLMSQEAVYQAALNVGARVLQPSLLDFLQ